MRYIVPPLLVLIGLTAGALAQEFTTEDPALSIDEMQAALVGNSWDFTTSDGVEYKEYIDPNGELRGETVADGRYTAHWKYRDEDALFCLDYGPVGMDPYTDGCGQMVKKGDAFAMRRLDGVIDATGTVLAGNAFGL